MNYIEYNDSVAFHPGYYIEEMIREGGSSVEAFAKELGMEPEHLAQICCGNAPVTPDIAEKLAHVTGSGQNYWLNLQNTWNRQINEVSLGG